MKKTNNQVNDISASTKFFNLIGEVNIENTSEICSEIIQENKNEESTVERFVIIINNYGGTLYGAFTLYDTIKASKIPVDTVCIGCAESAASIIFSAGRNRLIYPHAHILIHKGALSTDDTFSNYFAQSKFYEENCFQWMKTVYFCVLNETGRNEVLKYFDSNTDQYITSDKSIEYGIATGIITSLDEI